MSAHSFTPGPWLIGEAQSIDETWSIVTTSGGSIIANVNDRHDRLSNARLISAAPDLLAALRLHQAWSDSEDAGPDYGDQTRATHPDGERIWRQWWDGNLSLCERAQDATRAAIAKAGQS